MNITNKNTKYLKGRKDYIEFYDDKERYILPMQVKDLLDYVSMVREVGERLKAVEVAKAKAGMSVDVELHNQAELAITIGNRFVNELAVELHNWRDAAIELFKLTQKVESNKNIQQLQEREQILSYDVINNDYFLPK